MESKEFTRLALAENDLCLGYTDDPDGLKKLMEEVEVYYRWDGVRKHFPDDNAVRQCLEIKVKRGSAEILFPFGMSIRETEILTVREKYKEREAVKAGMLYSLLCCMRSEGYRPGSFQEFCGEMGYDTDSRKAVAMWEACHEQAAKLARIFREADLNCLPS